MSEHVTEASAENVIDINSEQVSKTETQQQYLIAFRLEDDSPMQIIASPSTRPWMDDTSQKFAYRCLPLLIANQSGWLILNSHMVKAVWTGEADVSSLSLEYPNGKGRYMGVSHFGHGIITWSLPYLFRTPPGYNLLVRGPSNAPKDGVAPLEGVVETDWATTTFTMNWKMTRSHHPITFEEGEPICMIVPQRRGELESFHPEIRHIQTDTNTNTSYKHWAHNREQFLEELKIPGSEAFNMLWQKDYFQGKYPDGTRHSEHQLKLHLREFKECDDKNNRGS